MSTDPWANTQVVDDRVREAQEGAASRLMEPNEEDTQKDVDSRLFGGDSLPSILTKKIDVGDSVTGVIRDLPFEKQGRTFVEGGTGELKYWENVPQPDPKTGNPVKVVTSAKGNDGKPNKPVMDLVIPLDTDYRYTAEQLEQRGLDSDDGGRGWYISGGDAEAKFKRAIRAAGIRRGEALIGKTITIKRVGKEKRGNFASWVHEVTIK